MKIREQIREAMNHIAKRRLGKTRLVYDRLYKRVRVKSPTGEDLGDAHIQPQDE